LASWRYRIDIPSRELINKGHACWEGDDGDIVYFAKHFGDKDLEVAEHCKSRGQKVVFDCCDDHFNNEFGDHYRKMALLADAVTVPTETMAQIVMDETGLEATVISDPYEYPEANPKTPGPKLFWFGHQSNLDTIKGLSLNGYQLGVLTGAQWSYENMLKGFSLTDIVIIPTNPKKQYKSPNRMVESIRQGHYVVAGPMPAYEGYGMWIGDIHEGIDWAINHPEEVQSAILDAQDIVREKHSPTVIGAQWETLFRSLL
jgi:hypothetical protein